MFIILIIVGYGVAVMVAGMLAVGMAVMVAMAAATVAATTAATSVVAGGTATVVAGRIGPRGRQMLSDRVTEACVACCYGAVGLTALGYATTYPGYPNPISAVQSSVILLVVTVTVVGYPLYASEEHPPRYGFAGTPVGPALCRTAGGFLLAVPAILVYIDVHTASRTIGNGMPMLLGVVAGLVGIWALVRPADATLGVMLAGGTAASWLGYSVIIPLTYEAYAGFQHDVGMGLATFAALEAATLGWAARNPPPPPDDDEGADDTSATSIAPRPQPGRRVEVTPADRPGGSRPSTHRSPPGTFTASHAAPVGKAARPPAVQIYNGNGSPVGRGWWLGPAADGSGVVYLLVGGKYGLHDQHGTLRPIGPTHPAWPTWLQPQPPSPAGPDDTTTPTGGR